MKATCLLEDLDTFPAGDMSEIGAKGSTVSGGIYNIFEIIVILIFVQAYVVFSELGPYYLVWLTPLTSNYKNTPHTPLIRSETANISGSCSLL